MSTSALRRTCRAVAAKAAALVLAGLAGGCGEPPFGVDEIGAGPRDASVARDLAAPDDGAVADLGGADAPMDLGGDDAAPDLAVPPGCNLGGIVCDGDWTTRCMPGCKPSECCSPQQGLFTCVPRDANDSCPLGDLFPDGPATSQSFYFEWRYFDQASCAVAEACVNGQGWRRLLRFDTWTPNIGGADIYLGPPGGALAPYFTWSQCHMHDHFNTYAKYTLSDIAGPVTSGRKQAFCVHDTYHYPGTDKTGQIYDCTDQGIQAGFQDVYFAELDCQWVDVTNVADGNYSLNIALNTSHLIAEADYTNNEVDVPVVIDSVSPNPLDACPVREVEEFRDCGWTVAHVGMCNPGVKVIVACSSGCGLGSCTGDTVMRICDGMQTCLSRDALAWNDDSGCLPNKCANGGDCCSQATFTCPASGEYTVLSAPWDSLKTATCNVMTVP